MMNRDEAKKAAEEYADSRWGTKEQARKLAVEWGPQMYDCERQETVRAYMACYDAMTKGEADGWCAWHPIMGFDAPTFETERRLIVNRGIESCVDKGASWAVKPVKLIKVEG